MAFEKSGGVFRLGKNRFEERIVGMGGQIGARREFLHAGFLVDVSQAGKRWKLAHPGFLGCGNFSIGGVAPDC